MARKITIALIGAGMFGGDVHARAFADLQRNGISGLMGRVGLDAWARDLADIEFDLVAVATRSEASAQRAKANFEQWTGHAPAPYWGRNTLGRCLARLSRPSTSWPSPHPTTCTRLWSSQH